jgi:hypothetical protein
VANVSIESFRVNFPPGVTPTDHPVIYLAYWHCRLLSYLFSPTALSSDILWACRESVGLLTANPQLLCPLTHHFSCLTSLSLLELSRVDKTREEAAKLLRELLESNTAPSAWDSAVRDRIAEKILPSASSGAEATASQSLQHLADLATANELPASMEKASEKPDEPVVFRASDNYEDAGFDPRPMLRAGYLNAFQPADVPPHAAI